jgi:hypothetical protein
MASDEVDAMILQRRIKIGEFAGFQIIGIQDGRIP